MIKTIAFDADDTLWHNGKIFLSAKEKYINLFSNYQDSKSIEKRLDETEMRNIEYYGYGIKSFTLSMIETSVELTDGAVTGNEIQEILKFAREMLTSPVELLEGVEETVKTLAKKFHLMVITKGDLFDQERKLASSGLTIYFDNLEIVSNKNKEVYQAILEKYEINPKEFLMVGNSLKSDVVPLLEIGSNAVHLAYETEWIHEKVSKERLKEFDFAKLDKISELLKLINQ